MQRQTTPLTPVLTRLRRPLTLTWAGLIAERLVRAFWPLWSLVATVSAVLLLGLHDLMPLELVWGAMIAALLAFGLVAVRGLRAFRWPSREDAVARIDASLPGHPLAALADAQAVGSGDRGSEALWRAWGRAAALRWPMARLGKAGSSRLPIPACPACI